MPMPQKHIEFIAEPMGDKPATALPGIADVLGERLKEAGFEKASTILGQYLVLNKDADLFKEWMKEICNASAKQANDCYNCLNDWWVQFLEN
uniref:Barrier-to-autointegration factor-like protein n=1 Tax=Glossina brevipalpis TaxID=37001 RepID=A0A1A9W8N3_9MUSC